MPKQVTAWKCDHCAMTSTRRNNVLRHEQHWCKMNPGRRSCHTCAHYIKEFLEWDDNAPFGAGGWESGCAVECPYFNAPHIDNCPQYEGVTAGEQVDNSAECE